MFEFLTERLNKTFLKQPLEKIDPEVPLGRVIRDLGNENSLRFQTYFDDVNGFSYIDQSMKASEQAQKIEIYRQTSKIAECSSGISEIVDEIVYSRDFKEPLKIEIELNNNKLEDAISKAFDKILNLFGTKRNLYAFVRQTYIDGQMNVFVKYNEKIKNGIESIYLLDPRFLWFDLEKQVYKYIDFNSQSSLKDNFMANTRFIQALSKNGKPLKINKEYLEFNIEEIVHQDFGLYSDSGIILSELEASVKTANQLKTLEDLLIPLRFSRSVSRRVFNIDLSELPNSKAEAYMRELTNKFKYKKQYNTETGEVLNNQHITTMVEDYWVGNKAGAKGMQVDVLDETGNLGELGDILYFYKLLYRSMGIPINRIYLDDNSQQPLFDLQADAITNEDIRFFQKITRLRGVYTEFLMQLLKRELISTKVCSEDQFEEFKENINIFFSDETQFIERMNTTLFMKKVEAFSTAQEFGGKILPVSVLFKEIFKFSDEEIKKNLKEIQKESKDPLFKHFYQSDEEEDFDSRDNDSGDKSFNQKDDDEYSENPDTNDSKFEEDGFSKSKPQLI